MARIEVSNSELTTLFMNRGSDVSKLVLRSRAYRPFTEEDSRIAAEIVAEFMEVYQETMQRAKIPADMLIKAMEKRGLIPSSESEE